MPGPSGSPPNGFTPPGRVEISDQALRLAQAFSDQIRSQQPEQDFVVAFDWAEVRRIRSPRDSNAWQDLGPGIDLAAYERRHLPRETIQRTGDLEFVVKIAEAAIAVSHRRLIDADDTVLPARLVLL